jgi:broad specificity phosphatase PhoE
MQMIIEKPFYFVRHAQTDHNRNHICAGGKTDVPLNKTGRSQARLLKKKIRSLDISRVICSPLQRTVDTAKLATSHPLILENGIRECELGDFEGKAVQDFLQFVENAKGNVSFPNGESKNAFNQRVLQAFNKALLNYSGTLLFVSHGMVYWSLLELMGIPFHYIPNAELVEFKVEGKAWKTVRFNSTNGLNYG